MIASDQRLDTGMTIGEAIRRAETWWGEFRGAVRRDFNRHRAAPKVRASGRRAPGLIIRAAEEETLPSGILSGKAWGKLTDQERVFVVKVWHHQHIREPLIDVAETEAKRFKHFGGRPS